MIACHKKHLFGGLSSEVWSKTFRCMVSTAKEGIFKRESTLIFEIRGSGRLPSNYKPLAKIVYEPPISKAARLEWHWRIVNYLDQLTLEDDAVTLDDALLTLHGHLVGEDGIETVLHKDA